MFAINFYLYGSKTIVNLGLEETSRCNTYGTGFCGPDPGVRVSIRSGRKNWGNNVSHSLILACLWVLAATLVALLPMRWQIAPGLALLVLAPPLLVYLAVQHNAWIVLAAVAALVSMFRRPLRVLLRYLLGRTKSHCRKEGQQS